MRVMAFPSLLSCLLLGACSNAIYFYETEKISLTIEGRPDPSQPIQGNLGLKQRGAIVVPPKQRRGGGGEALSLISSFRFEKADEAGLDPVLIRAALVTGQAAKDLKPDEASNAARALSGVEPLSVNELAKKIVNLVEDKGRIEELSNLVRKPWAELTPEDKQKLQDIMDTQSNERLHQALRNALNVED